MSQALESLAPREPIGSISDATMAPPESSRRPTGEQARRAQVIALPELSTPTEPAKATPLISDWHPLHQVKATLEAKVGEVAVTVGELLSAKEHHVLRLDRAVDQAIDLTIEGKVVARGQLVAVDGHFAVRITELPVALGLASRG